MRLFGRRSLDWTNFIEDFKAESFRGYTEIAFLRFSPASKLLLKFEILKIFTAQN